MLVFVGDDVTADVKEFNNLDFHTIFFLDLSFERILKGFAKFHGSAGDFPLPALIFCLVTAKREEQFSLTIENRRSNSDTDLVYPMLHITSCNYIRQKVYYNLHTRRF